MSHNLHPCSVLPKTVVVSLLIIPCMIHLPASFWTSTRFMKTRFVLPIWGKLSPSGSVRLIMHGFTDVAVRREDKQLRPLPQMQQRYGRPILCI